MSRKVFLAGFILLSGFLVAAGILMFSDFSVAKLAAAYQSPKWAQETGAGISVPACSSASADTPTCSSDGTAQATVRWTYDNNHGSCSYAKIMLRTTGAFSPNKGCSDSYTFTNLTRNTTYEYNVVWYDSGGATIDQTGWLSFQTPNCPVCTPNETRSCTTILSCPGTQTCNADGSGWGICQDIPGDNCPLPNLVPKNLTIFVQ